MMFDHHQRRWQMDIVAVLKVTRMREAIYGNSIFLYFENKIYRGTEFVYEPFIMYFMIMNERK